LLTVAVILQIVLLGRSMRRDPQEYRTDADARCEYAARPDTTARLRRRDDLDVDWGCFCSLYFMGISLKNPRLTLPAKRSSVDSGDPNGSNRSGRSLFGCG
jgi:hypothetical protein